MPDTMQAAWSPGEAEAAPVVLEVQELAVDFPSRRGVFRAVDGVDLVLRAGRTLAVVGESGSGKSVTARAILQILDQPGRIAAGRVLLHRHHTTKGAAASGGAEEVVELSAMPARSAAIRAIRGRDIAMIFQEPMSSLSPVHTIGAQIIEAIRLHDRLGKRAARERAIDLLRQVEIPRPETAVDRYTFEFSGGMRQRAMIAMALACNPSVLIADEPTTALDVTTQAEILDLIRRLQASHGMAVMLITHDMGVVAEMADEVAVMRHGQVVERGGILDVFERPQHDYTRMLLGAVRALDRPSPRRLAMRATKPPGAPILRLDALRKVFPSARRMFRPAAPPVVAVDDVTLDLHAGETLGIVGESGSGKTTLGRCVMGLFQGLGGRIEYVGRDGSRIDLLGMRESALRPLRREIRMVFQDPFASLNPRMTVEQIVGEPMLVNGTHRGAALQRRVAELLDMVGLPDSAMERYPHAFSGGQRQRIGIARAIALEPRVIVADEPTSALDVSLRSQVLDLLLDLQERLGLSFLFISHDIGVIRYFCDRVAVMYRGKVVEIGETEAVCTAPQHAYTRALLSAVPHPDPRHRGMTGRHRYTEGA
ncbi:ABC transporter ATP-binding protein [Roseomonas sp. AR75]|uniref:ABC transporter ATP-binding protein n=1 Tax=Roseomonas sp. AR75 TaxID=2562311 RepID=UPI00198211C3|nr:ABC transporter ATP-binding protein [Roseomonas sp. AR75]